MTTIHFQAPGYDWAPGEPRVDLTSRDSIIAWLVWNDRNGCYTDADCAVEDLDPLTVDTALDCLREAFVSATGETIRLYDHECETCHREAWNVGGEHWYCNAHIGGI